MEWTALSARQGGVIGRDQLRQCGLYADQIDHLLVARRVEHVDGWPGVYSVSGADIGELGRLSAVLIGTSGVLSFESAAIWWGLRPGPMRRIHVTVGGRRRVARRWGVVVHRVRLPDESVTVHRDVRVTTVSETVFDWLGSLPSREALGVADRALRQRWITEASLAHRLRSQPGRWGNVRLREVLDRVSDGIEAESERRLHTLLRAHGVTGWRAQHEVLCRDGTRYRIDVAFREHRLAVEVDGRSVHNTHDSFTSDRRRQNALVREGWTVLRFTWDDLVDRPFSVIAEIRQVLAA